MSIRPSSVAAVFAILTTSALAQTGPLVQVQRAGNTIGGGGGWYGYEQGWTYSIFTPQVQHELELVGEQLEKIKQIRTDFYKQQQELYKDLYKDGAPDALAREFHNERVAALREQMTKQLGEALLPHQVERAKQVWLQTQLQGRGGSAFANPSVRELLEITPEQHRRMLERANELNAEIMKKYAELREQAAEELLKELTPEQQKKLAELQGDKYEPVQIDYRKLYEQRRAEQQKQAEERKKQAEEKAQ